MAHSSVSLGRGTGIPAKSELCFLPELDLSRRTAERPLLGDSSVPAPGRASLYCTGPTLQETGFLFISGSHLKELSLPASRPEVARKPRLYQQEPGLWLDVTVGECSLTRPYPLDAVCWLACMPARGTMHTEALDALCARPVGRSLPARGLRGALPALRFLAVVRRYCCNENPGSQGRVL